MLKVQVLEPFQIFDFGKPNLSKKFPKGKFFLQNNLEKTRKFYEFILVDSDFVEITHIPNESSTKICYSKCKICKVISQNFRPKYCDYYDYMDAWYFTFFFRPFDHSWFFHWGDEIKNQTDFPNWFQEWWLFFGAIKDIFCPQILEGYTYFFEHGSHLVPTPCSKVLFFLSRFQIPWILCWDFILS